MNVCADGSPPLQPTRLESSTANAWVHAKISRRRKVELKRSRPTDDNVASRLTSAGAADLLRLCDGGCTSSDGEARLLAMSRLIVVLLTVLLAAAVLTSLKESDLPSLLESRFLLTKRPPASLFATLTGGASRGRDAGGGNGG